MEVKKRQIKEKIVKFFTHNLLRLLALFVRKRNNIWVFGEWQGNLFTDNCRYFYEYVNENHRDILSIWLTKNKNVHRKIRSAGGRTYLYNTLNALRYALLARVYVFNNGIEDVCHYALRRAVTINLWHGMPVKRLETDQREAKNFSYWRQIERRIIARLTTSQIDGEFDLLAATSELTKQSLYTKFRCKNIKVTGQPREDLFYRRVSKNEVLAKVDLERFKDKTIITYLPTFRDGKDENVAPLGENKRELKQFFEKQKNALLLEKSHFHERHVASNFDLRFDNYRNLSNVDVDTQELLAITDILITDYSSVFIDFLHRDRPIIFFAYDLAAYRKERDFYYEYEKIACGKIVYKVPEVFQAISEYLEDPKKDAEKRTEAKKLFHRYMDGGSCSRVYDEVIMLL